MEVQGDGRIWITSDRIKDLFTESKGLRDGLHNLADALRLLLSVDESRRDLAKSLAI